MASIALPFPQVPDDDRAFLGHPRGLAYLAFTGAWERFSFYGMSALLLLYMIQRVLTPDVMGGVWGLGSISSPSPIRQRRCRRRVGRVRLLCKVRGRHGVFEPTPSLVPDGRAFAGCDRECVLRTCSKSVMRAAYGSRNHGRTVMYGLMVMAASLIGTSTAIVGAAVFAARHSRRAHIFMFGS